MSVLTQNNKFELPGGSYSVTNIQYYCDYTIKKLETATENPQIRRYINKTAKSITSKVKTGYSPEFLMPETVKLLHALTNKSTAQ